MVKVAPGGPAHRAAPKLPAGGKSGGSSGGGGDKGGGGAGAAKVLRQTEELQHLLRLRAEELVARDNDLAACGEQIVKLESQNAELQQENQNLAQDLQNLTRQLEMLSAQYTDLSEKHGALRTENGLQRAELEEKKKLIASTPGLKPTPSTAKEAIKKAVEATEAPAPQIASGGGEGGAGTGGAGRGGSKLASWPGHSSEERTVWNSLQWLGTTAVHRLISKALLAPLESMPKEQRPRELTYIRAFAGKDGPAALLELLSQGSLRLIYELRDELHGAIKKLAERVPSRPDEVSGKYVEVLDESIGALQQGGVTTFDERLEELIGPPHSRVLETMLQEHCEAPDASTPFVASTYMLTTTSKIEWWFVVDPVDGLVKHVDPRAELGDTHVPRLSSTGWPAEAGVLAPERARVPRTLQALLQEMRLLKIGAQLKAAGSEPLVDAEVIAARLYTGPLYVKYTAVLKALSKGAGKLTSSVAAGGSGSGYSSDEYARQRAEKARQQDEEQMRYFEALCLGNTYATTIHALNSALIKLGKLGGAERVYRGVSSAVLPDWLWELSGGGNGKPIISSSLSGGGDEDGGGGDGVLTPALGGNGQLSKPRGGIEFGFLSATSDAELAMRYAADTPGSGGHAHRIVLELHTSMLTRAADLSWLSQYPHERECAFPPLTGHELIGTRIDGSCFVVELRLSSKTHTETLHQRITKLKRSHLQLIEHYLEDMRVCEVPEKALGQLRALANTHRRYEQTYYNNPEKYVSSTEAAVAAQRAAISRLAHPSTWDEVPGDGPEKARKMEKAAAYCRRVGRGDVASQLHRLANAMAAGKGGWRPWRPGGTLKAAHNLKGLA